MTTIKNISEVIFYIGILATVGGFLMVAVIYCALLLFAEYGVRFI